MPFVGLGLHVLVALFFAVDVVRNGRQLYWLLILFSFPLLGSIVYFFAIYLPGSRLEHSARKASAGVAKALDPGRELREAKQAFELTPTAQNQMRLANALLEEGSAEQAIAQFEACLKGPFANDPEIRLGAARAHLAHGNGKAAIELLLAIRKQRADYRQEDVSLLLAQAYARAELNTEAQAEFAFVVERFGSIEAKIEYAIWAASIGNADLALNLKHEIEQSMRHWNKHTRQLNKELTRRLDAALGKLGQ
ncbi:MAG TPA: tetratricopeptide repeat protein [Rhodocyclaceae bacterium]|nr:tetratricopeptide repeat protein [Rhodocyclaceae bacterium]